MFQCRRIKTGGFFRRMFKRIAGKEDAPREQPVVAQADAPKPQAKAAEPKPAKAKAKAKPKPKPPEKKPAKKEKPRKQPETKAPPPGEPRAAPRRVAHEAAPDEPREQQRRGWFRRIKDGLSKSSQALSSGISDIFTKRKLDDDTLQQLEDILIQADLGIDTATAITQAVAEGRYDKEVEPEEIRRILSGEVRKVLEPVARPFTFGAGQQPFVILVVGVNGTGKTTTIGKLAAIAGQENFSVMIAACDTFRAAAIDQLKVWGERSGAPVVAGAQGSDASGVAYEAMRRAREAGCDILMIDTAGRLQNKADLMGELEKIIRVVKKHDDTAPHAVLLILDATTGQNAISQAAVFHRTAGVTGIIMTKLDGTARGGILVAIAAGFGLPIHAIGIGEGVDDLRPFDAEEFSKAIAGIDLDT